MARRRIKPTEVRAVAALLDDPADDVHELAASVVAKLNELRESEAAWVAVCVSRGKLVAVYGPYASHTSARADVVRGKLPTPGHDARWSVYRMGVAK